MDDDMEDEILYEVFSTHAYIIWRYLGVTTAGLVDLVMPGPGETLKTKIFQPGPFMFLMFLVIVASVALQSSSHLVRRWMLRAHYVVGLGSVAGTTLKTLSGLDLGTLENVTWEFKEGIVGLYGMQGRRGNMEDRFSVIQDVDVGEKRMSFFGVFDGHGGQDPILRKGPGVALQKLLEKNRSTVQKLYCEERRIFTSFHEGRSFKLDVYTAEYVKDNLFRNMIEKIKQLRSQIYSNQEKGKNGNNNVMRNNSKNSGGGTTNGSERKTEKRGSTVSEKSSGAIREKRGSVSEEKPQNTCAKDSQSSSFLAGNRETESCPKRLDKDNDVVLLENGVVESAHVENSKCEKEVCPETSQRNSGVEDITQGDGSCPSDSEVSMKKDDTYSSLNFVKRNSIATISGTTVCKEKKEEAIPDVGYIDPYKNMNYTRLLTDQIIAIDKQVVEQCKKRTDMSGTTAVIAVLDGELLIIGNVGDSRAVMGDLKGSTIPLSFDHKPNQLKERRRIKEAGGFITFTGVWRVAGILATSRALGDFPLKEPRKLVTAEPDVLTFSLRDHKAHFVILATDGLWDVLTNEEAVAFVRDHIHEPDFGARSLSIHAYSCGSQDNITVVILNIDKLSL